MQENDRVDNISAEQAAHTDEVVAQAAKSFQCHITVAPCAAYRHAPAERWILLLKHFLTKGPPLCRASLISIHLRTAIYSLFLKATQRRCEFSVKCVRLVVVAIEWLLRFGHRQRLLWLWPSRLKHD